jgi:gluconolactonase
MFVADAGLKAILRITDSGTVEAFIDSSEGSPLEGPNDLAFLPDGSLIFSDPLRVPLPDPAISPVYRATMAGEVQRFFSDLAYPNGVAVAASNDEVLVSEMRAHRIIGLGLGDDMTAVGQRMVRRFREPAAPDGMAVDSEGRILVALPGIRAIAVIGTRNELQELYHVAEWQPSNLCFGDPDRRTVFVTSESDGAIYSFRHSTGGKSLP